MHARRAARVYGRWEVATIEERFASEDPNARIAAAVLRSMFGPAYARNFSVRLWEGTLIPAQEERRFTLCFRTGRMGLFQSLLAKPLPGGALPDVPATRRDLYQTWASSSP